MNPKLKVLVVGQTPPPWGGQAVMIQQLLEADFERVELFHARMAFSKDMDDIGRVRAGKVLHLVKLIAGIVWMRCRHRTRVLYYPPAGPDRVPVYRDLVVLGCTRWLFRKTIFHFHASGVSEMYPHLSSRALRWCFRRAYFKPDLTIRTSARNPADGDRLHSRRDVVVPNGLADANSGSGAEGPGENVGTPVILFVGAIRASKGVEVLLDAAARLLRDGHDFHIDLVGRSEAGYRERLDRLVTDHGLEGRVSFPGVLTGAAKWAAYARCRIFCFPSFFESESFGLVALEAMMFGKPVVATNWRGLPDVVVDGETGLLVPVRDPESTAEALARLLQDPDQCRSLGEAGRRRYLERFSLPAHLEAMQHAFDSVVNE